MIARLVHTTSRQTDTAKAMARVLAGPRIKQERERAARRLERALQVVELTGQLSTDREEWCFICSRATDHLGEHDQDQIDAWRARQG